MFLNHPWNIDPGFCLNPPDIRRANRGPRLAKKLLSYFLHEVIMETVEMIRLISTYWLSAFWNNPQLEG